MAFADFYPYADFAAIADAAWWRANDFDTSKGNYDKAAYNAALRADQADRTRIDAHKEVFAAAVKAHLTALRDACVLKPTGGLAGRELSIPNAWNDFVAGKKGDHTRNWMFHGFRSVWTRAVIRMDTDRRSRKRAEGYVPGTHTAPTDDMIKAAWLSICDAMDSGNSNDDHGIIDWSIECIDQKSGDSCKLQFDSWAATLMVFDKDYNLVPAKDISALKLVTATFPVPSGKLMLSDAFRIEGFPEGTDFSDDEEYSTYDLSNAAGCSACITGHAKEHGFGFTQTTNTSVAVYRQKGSQRLIVTERWFNDKWPEDAKGRPIVEGWDFVGDFSCDVWSIKAIAPETVIARMKAGGCTNAEQEFSRYLAMANADIDLNDHQAHHEKCYAGNIVQLDVQAGDWQIHSGDNFNKRVNRKKYGIPKGVKVWCVLEPAA